MAVPKPHDGPTADRDRDWNWSEQGGEQIDKMAEHGGWKQVAEAHAWYDDTDGDPPEKKGAYKLPHHELIGGRLQVASLLMYAGFRWVSSLGASHVVVLGRTGSTVELYGKMAFRGAGRRFASGAVEYELM